VWEKKNFFIWPAPPFFDKKRRRLLRLDKVICSAKAGDFVECKGGAKKLEKTSKIALQKQFMF
jgi:hypothetical protein